MPEFVNVPVPADLVTAVMRFIADQTTPGGSGADASARVDAQSRDWSEDQLRQLRDSDAPSVKVFAQVLTILADASPEAIPVGKLAELTGVEDGLTLQKKFGAVTRWMRNRLGGDTRWPIHFPADGWAMNSHNASLWKSITQ
ncbi:hypothetical protein ACH3VR_03900 [Microbacterium sp. B2969]|uniref:Uncharacterized protein n=1 Tax=Microbacterium alkaliflavum TaxID=3248839 RepID=A0ABW7Q467_9MICO